MLTIGFVGALGVAVLPARKEVLGAPELHLVEVARARMLGDELRHYFHGLFGASELVAGSRLLVEHLVAISVGRVLREQLLVELDGFGRAGTLEVSGCPLRQRQFRQCLGGGDGRLARDALLELALGNGGHLRFDSLAACGGAHIDRRGGRG